MITIEIEIAVANLFGLRKQSAILTNLSWGFGLDYEADLVIVTKSGYLYEVEIKVSKYDLIKDKHKIHNHKSNKFRKLYFAIPKNLIDCIEHIPERAGIIICDRFEYDGNQFVKAEYFREAEINKQAKQISDVELFKLLRLGTMRQWTIKRKLVKLLNKE